MKLELSLLILLSLSISTNYGQAIQKCDLSILVKTDEDLGKLKKVEIKIFLLTFGEECRRHVEYSEWSNELLFSLLDKQTELTLKTIAKEKKKIELEEIMNVLRTPIGDMNNMKYLISKVEKVNINRPLKKEMIQNLTMADRKNNKF